MSTIKCAQCGERLLSKGGGADKTGKIWYKRECKNGHKLSTITMTREQLQKVRENTRKKCPECGNKTRMSNTRKLQHYTRRYRSCVCGWKETTYEINSKLFKALLEEAEVDLCALGV